MDRPAGGTVQHKGSQQCLRKRSGRYVKNPGKYRPVEAYEEAGQYGARGGGSNDERTIHLPHSILILKSYHSLISVEASDRPWGPLVPRYKIDI